MSSNYCSSGELPAQEEAQSQRSLSETESGSISSHLCVHTFGKRLRSSGLWAIIGRISSVLILLIFHAWLARSMSQADYGRYVLLESAVVIISLIALGGLPISGIRLLRRHLSGHDYQNATAIVHACLIMIVVSALATAFGTSVLAWLTRDYLINGLLWNVLPWAITWAVCAAALRLMSELFRGYDQFALAYVFGGQSGGFGVNFGLLVGAIAVGITSGLTLSAVLGIQVTVQVVFIIFSGVVLLKYASVDSHLEKAPLIPAIKTVFASAWPLLIMQLITFGLPEMDTILVGSYMKAEDAALYGAARRLMVVIYAPYLLVQNALQPFIADIHTAGDTRRLSTLVRGTSTIASIPSMAVIVVLLLFPDVVLQMLYGDRFVAAAPALRILSFGYAIGVLAGSSGQVLVMTGHERSAMNRSLLCCGLYIAVAPIMVINFGLAGAAVSNAALQVLAIIITALLVFKYEKFWPVVTLSPKSIIACYHLFCPPPCVAPDDGGDVQPPLENDQARCYESRTS